ncbi:hypothetical protein MJH12_14325 [bacterium]|nr:hypothetical protein [bacterium]
MKNIQIKFSLHLFCSFLLCFLMGCGGSEDKKAPAPKAMVKAPEKATSSVSDKVVEDEEAEDEDEELDFEDMEIEEVQESLENLLNNKKFEMAKNAVQVLLEDDSEPLDYHFTSGKIYFELSEFDLAMDEFSHVRHELKNLEEDEEELGFQISDLDLAFKKAEDQAQTLKKSFANMDNDKELADLLITVLKLDPKFSFEGIQVKKGPYTNKTYFVVKSLKYYQESLKEEKSFWNYYKYSFLNFQMKWYSDAVKSIEKSLSLADTQAQIFFALMLQGKIQLVAPKGKQSELDKLSALDLTEDMLDEFLGKYSKTLNQKQMEKARVMMNKAMKLKTKLDRAESDETRLKLLKTFIVDSDDLLSGKDFPPDIRKKMKSASQKSHKRLAELEEQIKIKKLVE